MNDKGNGNGRIERIELLKERERKIRADLAAEILKRKRREFKEYDRLKSIVGGACLAVAHQNADFELMLRDVLKTAPIVEADKKVLRAQGWV